MFSASQARGHREVIARFFSCRRQNRHRSITVMKAEVLSHEP